jgi:hypothetical protein
VLSGPPVAFFHVGADVVFRRGQKPGEHVPSPGNLENNSRFGFQRP